MASLDVEERTVFSDIAKHINDARIKIAALCRAEELIYRHLALVRRKPKEADLYLMDACSAMRDAEISEAQKFRWFEEKDIPGRVFIRYLTTSRLA